MLAHIDPFGFFVLFVDFLHLEPEVETGALPGEVGDFLSVNFLGEGFGILTGRDRDEGDGVHVIDMLGPDEAVQGGVDGRGAGVQIEGGMGIHVHHLIFDGSLHAIGSGRAIDGLQADELLLIERRKVFHL